MNYDYIGATGENNIKDYIDITSNILNINSSNYILNSSNYTRNASNILQNNLNTVNNKLIVIDNSISSIESSITTLQNEVIAVQGETTANTAAIADISPIVAADTITLAGLVPVVGGHTLAIISLDGSIANCLKKENIDSGNIGLYQSLGGAFLNIVYNLNHFKDVPVIGTNREFNLNDTYANLPTTKNNKITWTSPLNYNTSTDTATIDLSNYYNKSEIVNISNNNNLNNSNYAANISNVIIKNSSNYASNISNVLLTNINFNNSNYASNISNIIIRNSSNYASNISNVIIINSSNYSSNISNVLLTTINFNSSNYASNISNVLLTNISLNNSNYASNISNVIITNVNNTYLKLSGGTLTGTLNGPVINATSTTTASEFKGIYINHAARITHIPYLPNGNIYFRAPVIIDNENDYLSFGSRTGDNIIRLYNNDFGFGINGGTLRYNVPMGSVHRFYHGTTNTAWIDDTGRLKATIFEGSGAALTNLPYSSITNFPDFLLKTGGTMTGGLILNHSNTNFWYNSPGTYFINNGFTSFFNLNANVNTNFGLQTQPFITVYNRMWKNVGNTAIDIRTLGGANNAVNSDITIRIDSGGDPTTGANKGTILFSIDGANRHIINRSAFGIANINPIAGNLCIGSSVNSEGGVSDGTLVISKNTSASFNRSFKFGYDTDFNFCMGDCLGNGNYTWRPTDFTISYNLGNIGIGTVNQSHKLNVNGSTYFNGNSTVNGTLNLLSTTSITPLFINSTATNSINNIEFKNNANNSCYIGIGGTGYSGNYINNLFLQSPNSLILNSGGRGTGSTPNMIINSSGNVGIGTTNPYSLLHIKGTNTALTIMGQGGTGAISQLNLSTYDTTTNLPNCSLIATDTGSYGATFQIKQKTLGADANAQFTSLFIDNAGNIGIGTTTNTTYKLYVNGTTYLNNNTTVNGSITTTSVNNSLISYFTATPYNNGSSPVNLASSVINLCCATTAGFGSTFNYLSVVCSDIGNYMGTIVYLSSTGQFWTGYNFNARIIVDSSYATNSGLPMGGSIFFQTSDTNNVSATTFKTICTINSRGLAIGSFTNNNYPLIVQGTTNATFSYVYVRTGYNGGGDFNSTSYNANVSAAFGGSIYVTTNLINSSDIRIKKEINDINDDGALRQILAIEPKTYKYIDYLSRGSSVVYGFIAQQIKEVIPQAVETVKDTIPNIYKPAFCSSNIITLDNDISQELNIGDNIKIYDELGKDDIYNITEINSNVIKIDKDINSSNVFVYGKEIDDFHTLKKDYIFSLNVCATQELYKLIQNQNIIIEDLKNRISILEQK
jgi:hypothetical protein